jgi:hypothetical protein
MRSSVVIGAQLTSTKHAPSCVRRELGHLRDHSALREVWHFAVRLQTMSTLKLLDALVDRFSIRPKDQR